MPQPSAQASDFIDKIRSEYFDMPGLALTLVQVERLWDLDPDVATTALEDLQSANFLKLTWRGTYVRADLAHAWRPMEG